MKIKTILLFIILTLGLSCKKSNDSQVTQSEASISFKANGVAYSFNGTPPIKFQPGTAIIKDFIGTNAQAGYYCIYASNSNFSTVLDFAFLPIGTPLSIGTYTKTSIGCDSKFNSVSYGKGNSCTVTITNVSNNKYSGTFEASLSTNFSTPTQTILITEGKFDNLEYTP